MHAKNPPSSVPKSSKLPSNLSSKLSSKPAMSAEVSSKPANLSWLAMQGLNVWVWCEGCNHQASLDPRALMGRLNDCNIPDLAQYLRCSKCQSRQIFARPDWPRMGRVSRALGFDD